METTLFYVLTAVVLMIDVIVLRLGFPMKNKSWRIFRFLFWFGAVVASLAFLMLVFGLFVFRNSGPHWGETWNRVVPFHVWFSFAFGLYLEWFSEFFRKNRRVSCSS
ncbi:MAG: hypothetical protein ACI861_000324 [Paracoccaceae bacterium]|jgi:hypothetical protein